jgi:hypothetical protein
VLAVLFGLAAMGAAEWPRLSSVLGVAAGLLLIVIAASLLIGAASTVTQAVTSTGGSSLDRVTRAVGDIGSGWKIVVAVGGLALAAAAAARRDPGIGWASAVVLALFVAITSTSKSSPSLIFWPLLFLVVGCSSSPPALSGEPWRGHRDGRPTDRIGGRVPARAQRRHVGGGLLLLAIGIAMTEARMAGRGGNVVTLIVVAVPAAIALACAFSQPAGGFSPPWATSLLAILALLLTASAFERLAAVIVDKSVNDLAPGTVTWVTGLSALVGVALVRRYRSAALVLVTYVLGAVAVLAAIDWIFGPDLKAHTYEYLLVGLALVYLGVAVVVSSGRGWKRCPASRRGSRSRSRWCSS